MSTTPLTLALMALRTFESVREDDERQGTLRHRAIMRLTEASTAQDYTDAAAYCLAAAERVSTEHHIEAARKLEGK